MTLLSRTCPLMLLFCIPLLSSIAQEQQAEMVSPSDADAVLSYFHQFPDSPDGSHLAFTIFHAPDSMEVVIKNLSSGQLTSIAKIKGQHRHTGTHPVWANNETLIYGSPAEHKVYHHNLRTGEIKKFAGGQISDYSVSSSKLLLINKNREIEKVGIYVLDVNTGEYGCIVSVDDVAELIDEIGTKNPPEYWRIDHPYWSPDGSKINFQIKTHKTKSTKEDDYIFYTDKIGDEIHFIGKKPMHVQWWDSNSVFGHDWFDKQDYHMRRYDLEGNLLEEVSGFGCHGTVSPDRNWIVTESWYGSDPIQVFLYKRGDTIATKILFEQPAEVNGIKFWKVRSHVHPAFSRDGKRVYFNGQGSDGKSKVWVYELSELIELQN